MATLYRPNPTNIIPADEPDQIETSGSSDSALSALNRSEVEMQMEFAQRKPRSIAQFRKRVLDRVTLNEDVALQMTYAVPRAGGTINGPSVRFAEVVASSWGNCIAGKRVVGIEGNYVIAQGVFFDVETNYKFAAEVRRRITTKEGRMFSEDMIQTTGNAAASIAYRNAVFGGISKGDWADLHDQAKATAIGKTETLGERRSKAMEFAKQMGITGEMVLNALGIKGSADMTGEHLVSLRGWLSQIKSGEAKIEDIFGSAETDRAEQIMAELGWNSAKKDMNRSSYRGRGSEQVAYLEGELEKFRKAQGTKAEKEGASAAKAETKPAEPETKQAQAETEKPKADPPKAKTKGGDEDW